MKKIFNFIASYNVATVLLFFLLLLTFFGTLEQVEHGLFEVQNKYFNSLFVIHELPYGIPLPLPGVYLLIGLLAVNMTAGAIIRAPKNIKQPGMLIAHGGIIFLLVAGFVTYHMSISGNMALLEGSSSSQFQSYHDWEIVVVELKEGGKRFTIPGDNFDAMSPEDTRLFTAEALPFDLLVEGYLKNCQPDAVAEGMAIGIDGVNLIPMELDKEAERNIRGAFVTLIENDAEQTHEGVLFGLSMVPWVVTVAGQDYSIDLRHERYDVPFTITLDKFIRDLHPGMSMASNFESEVTKTEGGVSRPIKIRMNEPLRHKGYTFFQASFGSAADGRSQSVFAVVNNPADQWPKYACYVVAIGLTIHFLQKLLAYLQAENRRRNNA
mgnify:CR=1 FL=1